MAPAMNEMLRLTNNERERGPTLHRQIGLKKGNDWRVLRAAWHLVTVGVEQVTEKHISSFVISANYNNLLCQFRMVI